jgi:hypothetical protein
VDIALQQGSATAASIPPPLLCTVTTHLQLMPGWFACWIAAVYLRLPPLSAVVYNWRFAVGCLLVITACRELLESLRGCCFVGGCRQFQRKRKAPWQHVLLLGLMPCSTQPQLYGLLHPHIAPPPIPQVGMLWG